MKRKNPVKSSNKSPTKNPKSAMKKKAKTIQEQVESRYDKKTDLEHILARPDTFVGGTDKTEKEYWIYDDDTERMKLEKLKITPAAFKVVDEILVNARDHSIRDPSVTKIMVNIDKDTSSISVYNNGNGIPIRQHSKFNNKYIPEMLFGDFRTSENYDDEQQKIVGGRNGYGAKCTNAFSKYFEVETVDAQLNKKWKQVFKDNMHDIGQPKITPYSKAPFTRISFILDFARFGMDGMEDDFIKLVKRRVYDLAGCTHERVNIYINGERIKTKTFAKYIDLFIGNQREGKRVYFELENSMKKPEDLAADKWSAIKDIKWEVGVTSSNDGFKHNSFVNGISTAIGGKHVNYIRDALARKLKAKILKAKKNISVTSQYIKDQLWIFVNATVVNPAFSSQTKEELTTEPRKFSFECSIPDNIVDQIEKKFSISQRVIRLAEFKESQNLSKTDGKKTRSVRGIAKLIDADQAGKKESDKCTLIITEGDSAKTFAASGLEVIGKKYYGVFPIKGKFLNVKQASVNQLLKNEEYNNLKRIIGLKEGEKYKDTSKLRYGSIMFLTDQDLDGFHIKALLCNLIREMWPSLLNIPGFLKCFITPLVVAKRGDQRQEFFNEQEFEVWKDSLPEDDLKHWKIGYFKGLGTSTPAEARGYFRAKDRYTRRYYCQNYDKVLELFDFAFSKDHVQKRKDWLRAYDHSSVVDYSKPRISFEELITKELIHFTNYDTRRSICNILDGLKISQRKILWVCKKINLYNALKKVDQVAGQVSEKSGYHHGEDSLKKAIVNMAQVFSGSNSINLFCPKGQYGCLDPNTEIMMWSGKTKKAKNIKVGDILVGDDGSKRTVLRTVNGVDEMYDVIQGRGNTYRVNKSHILTLCFNKHKKIYWKKNSCRWTMDYWNHDLGKISSKSISTTESTLNSHFNASLLSKEDAYKLMVKFANEISDNDIVDITVSDYLSLPKTVKRELRGFISNNCINWDHVDTPIDPYILGMWIGDGRSDGRGFTSADAELVKEWVKWCDSIGLEVTHYKNAPNLEGYQYGFRRRETVHNNRNRSIIAVGHKDHSSSTCIGCQTSDKIHPVCDWVFNDKTDTPNDKYDSHTKHGQRRNDMNPFVNMIKKLKLFNNKHIPHNYIINDEETRLQLLAGIIDTDGCLKKNKYMSYFEITQCQERSHIINDIQFIANSLGFRTSTHEVTKQSPSGKTFVQKCVLISGYNVYRIPTKLKRKQAKKPLKYINSFCTKIELKSAGKGKFVGWQVDKNERFLLGDFTVTHNSRLKNGKDAASTRYINTKLNSIAKTIYPPEDDPLLEYNEDDDGKQIEPRYYVPIIPMVLANGCEGIGTGYSSSITLFHPKEIINNVRNLIKGKKLTEMIPWFQGFKGTVKKLKSNQYKVTGTYNRLNNTTISVTELPVGSKGCKSFEDYKAFLEESIIVKNEKDPKKKRKQFIKDYNDPVISDMNCQFDIEFPTKQVVDKLIKSKTLENKLKLEQTISTTNMYGFDDKESIQKFTSVNDLFKYFFKIRKEYYEKRKVYMIEQLEKLIKELGEKVRFLSLIISEELPVKQITQWKDKQFDEYLEQQQFMRMNGEFNYLTGLSIKKLNQEQMEKLEKQLAEKVTELEKLKGLSIEVWWLKELDKLEKELDELWEENRKIIMENEKKPAKKGKKKQRTNK